MKKLAMFGTLAGLLCSPNLFAFEAGDWIVRAGAITVTTNEKSSSVQVDRGALAGTDLGGKATLDNSMQLGLNFVYMFTPYVGLELLAATPFEHTVHVKGTGAVDGKLGRVKHLPPALSAVFYPNAGASRYQPYLGIGAQYVLFHHEKVSDAAKAGALPLTDFKVQNTWAWTAQIGMDIMLTDNVMLNGQIRYSAIDTTAYVEVDNGAQRAKVDVDIKPWIYMVGVGYKF